MGNLTIASALDVIYTTTNAALDLGSNTLNITASDDVVLSNITAGTANIAVADDVLIDGTSVISGVLTITDTNDSGVILAAGLPFTNGGMTEITFFDAGSSISADVFNLQAGNGSIDVQTVDLTSMNTINLISNGAGDVTINGLTANDVTINAGSGAVSFATAISTFDNLNVVASSAVSQTAAGAIVINEPGGDATFISSGNIILDALNNFTTTTVHATGIDITLTDTDQIGLGMITALGNLTVTAGGSIVGSLGSAVSVAGNTTLTAWDGGTTYFDILLDGPANDFAGQVTATGGDITIADINDVSFADVTGHTNTDTTINVQTGAINLSAGGVLQAGSLVGAFPVTGTSGTISSTDGDITLSSTGDMFLFADVTTTNGDLTATSGSAMLVESSATIQADRVTLTAQNAFHQATAIGASFTIIGDGNSAGDGVYISGSDVNIYGAVTTPGSGGVIQITATAGDVYVGAQPAGPVPLLPTLTHPAAPGNVGVLSGTGAMLITATNDITLDAGSFIGFGATTSFEAGNDITLNTALTYDMTDSLTMLAGNNINLNASVQNSNATGGDLNLVAGWDGTTGAMGTFSAAAFDADPLASATLFGAGTGSVNITDSTASPGTAVGSRSGNTRVYAHDLTLTGSTADAFGFAQLGFQASDQGAGFDITGDIGVRLTGGITATGGGNRLSYAQIGHVGADTLTDTTVEATVDAAIHIEALGDLSFTGGSFTFSYAQLGHGGVNTNANLSGDITIASANDLVFEGGTSSSNYAQLGHGGAAAVGDHNGAILITSANDLSFTGGTGLTSYAQLGHGGLSADGDHSGEITITSANDLTFMGGVGADAYAKLGHGGTLADGNHSGAITIVSANDLSFTGAGGVSLFGYAQLGHGGFNADGNLSGAITILSANDLRLGGGGTGAYAQLGHGSASFGTPSLSAGTRSGDIFVNLTGAMMLQDGASPDISLNYAWLGHGSQTVDAISNADIYVQAFGFSRDLLALLAVGNTGLFSTDMIENGLEGGNVTLVATQTGLELEAATGAVSNDQTYDEANDLTLVAAYDLDFGSVGLLNSNDTSGAINLVAGYNPGNMLWNVDAANSSTWALPVSAFDGTTLGVDPLFGQNMGSVIIGDGTQSSGVAVGARSGNTRVYAHDLTVTGSTTTNNAFAQLGFQVSDQGAAYAVTGDIGLRLTGGITAAGGSQDYTYAQIGHVGADVSFNSTVDATTTAAIHVEALGDLSIAGGADLGAYAQLGHGGYYADGNHGGTITITSANDLGITGGIRFDAYAQLGHGGIGADGDHSGTITILSANDLSFTGGSGISAYAQLGHGGVAALGDHSGDITLTQIGNLSFTGGADFGAYTQLGHGGNIADGDHSGAITISSASDLSFAGGTGADTYAQLGHGGRAALGNHSGAITITSAHDLSFVGGGSGAYTQLGHGGVQAFGDHSGAITITSANNLNFMGGGGGAYAQLGHGESGTIGGHSGAITITAANDLTFNTAQLGHAGLDNQTGDITLDTVGNLAFTQAQLGHTAQFGNSSGAITIGSAGNLIFAGGTTGGSLLGHSGRGDHTGDILLGTVLDVTFAAGDNSMKGFAQLGHRGLGDHSGDIRIDQADDITFSGGNGLDPSLSTSNAYAQLGHGGTNTTGTLSGDIVITQANSLSFAGGSSVVGYALLGHGGFGATANMTGDIAIGTVNDVNISGGWATPPSR